MAYPPEAIERAWEGYAGHRTQEQIVRDLRDAGWTQFSRSTLNEWIERYDWAERRSAADAKRQASEDRRGSIQDQLLAQSFELWEKLHARITEGRAKREEIWLYKDTARLIAELTKPARSGQDDRPPGDAPGPDLIRRIKEEVYGIVDDPPAEESS